MGIWDHRFSTRILTGPVVPPFAGYVLIAVPIAGYPFFIVNFIYWSLTLPRSVWHICILLLVKVNVIWWLSVF